jgi:uncharacterized Zn-finger protein
MQPFEIIPVDTRIVACNGGGGALGHPAVYLNLGPNHQVECPYCSRLYVLESASSHAPADAHA